METQTYDNLYNRYRELDIPNSVFDWAWKLYDDLINTLYYPNIYIFPLTPEGEELMELFFKEIISCRYGTYTFTNTCDIDGEIYNIVIENND